ncbi:hypothetical protein CARUB_v10020348mg [Capsella rubella]|uniref:F-box domain-containing protein n=1 Tax=Capsella rubella TaxID=81985 RepID=R0IEP1_9BRAS|nr:FBD-associated F-box protein At1g60410 [Capsella rubella]XP_023643782.1 FBD-associated F-box protein At1g60410 [Capsella rubella]EOA35198.1 hypothetical protein CARUB_v10020348mg [Capsella rubella]
MVRTSLNTSVSNKKRIKTNVGRDRISDLPCDVLVRILTHLSTKESVGTSYFNRRWEYLWSEVPVLDLHFNDFIDTDFELLDFIDYFLDSKPPSLKLDTFKLVYGVVNEHSHEPFVSTLDKVVRRGVSHLTLINMVSNDAALVRMPLSLYSSSTLVDLNLYTVVFDDPGAESVSLPRVKIMQLEGVKFDGGDVFKNLISSCPVLEELTVVTHYQDDLELVCVQSQSLKTFTLMSERPKEEERDPDVVIDAPRLEYMSISDFQPEGFIISNIGLSAEADVDIVFEDVDLYEYLDVMKICNFLIGISKFQELTISARTLHVIHEYSEVTTLPKFHNLSRLEVLLIESSWEYLAAFLGCCMNLNSLILELDHIPEKEEIEQSPVPQCVLSSLHSLHLKTPQTPSKKVLVSYFRDNCTALRKILVTGRE